MVINKKLLITILSVVTLLVGGALVAAEEIIIFEQAEGSRMYWVYSGWNHSIFAQTFTTKIGGPLKRVDLKACGDFFKIHFYKAADGFAGPDFPSAKPLVSYEVEEFYNCGPNDELKAAIITTNDDFIIQPGVAYAMVIESDNTTIIANDEGGIYSGGTLMFYKNNQWLDLNSDLVMRLWDDPLVREIEIDVKPGDEKNILASKSGGLAPVAILSAENFDILMIDKNSLTFGAIGDEQTFHSCVDAGRIRDLNGDGLADLVCLFNLANAGFGPDSREATLSGQLVDGAFFKGVSPVKMAR